jgi:hypothetical protein
MILILLALAAWLLGIGFGAMMAFGEGNYALGIFLAALAYAPVATLKLRARAALRKTEERMGDLKRSLGDGEALAWHAEKDTGIFVDSARRKVGVVAGAATRAYDYGDVRSWSTRAMPNDWMFVVAVKDAQNPMWRIRMRNSAERDRWMEILQQEIHESRASA